MACVANCIWYWPIKGSSSLNWIGYFAHHLAKEDPIFKRVRESAQLNNLPQHEVSPLQGKLLSFFTSAIQAKRVLEIGTLVGYSTLWLAQGMASKGSLVTLEISKACAAIARHNFKLAGIEEMIEVMEGPALESLKSLLDKNGDPFDLVFIDADKRNNRMYLDYAIRLTRSGGIIIGDNVVRNGEVNDFESVDPSVLGIRGFISDMGSDPRLLATAIQTVGLKGWDGFSIALVRK